MSEPTDSNGLLTFLYLEDVPADVELVREHLADEGFAFEMSAASSRQEYSELLGQGGWDLILVDYTLPGFDAPMALEMAKELCPDVPFICISGTVGEDRAVELLKQGATDYVLKDRMGRLAFAVRRALESARRDRERRASDELNKLLVENMADVLWILDVESGTFTYVSPSVERLRGFTSEEVTGQPLDFAIAPEELQWVHEALEARIAAFMAGDQSATIGTYEVLQPRKDGSTVQTEVTTTLRRNSRGGMDVIGVTRDVTKRKRAEAELARHRDHLEELVKERTAELERVNLELRDASRAKSDFLARMSHDLRTPLNSIIGFSQVMLMGAAGELNEEQGRHATIIHESGTYLLQLVNDILDLSRIEAGRMEACSKLFDAGKAVKDVVDNMIVQAEERGLSLRLHVPEVPVMMTSDELRLRQILLNLVSNAVRFTSEGDVDVELAQADDSAVITVRDTGIGIAPEHMHHLFEDFWQASEPGVPGTGGSGLGLPISIRLATLLGGTLTAESALGAGSTFTLRLPLVLTIGDEA